MLERTLDTLANILTVLVMVVLFPITVIGYLLILFWFGATSAYTEILKFARGKQDVQGGNDNCKQSHKR
jgi:hypothetical protein